MRKQASGKQKGKKGYNTTGEDIGEAANESRPDSEGVACGCAPVRFRPSATSLLLVVGSGRWIGV